MAEPLRVAVRRGTFVESVHEVHGVAVRDGETLVSFGDPSLTASLRSSAKPLQALPLARAYPELGAEELAIASASHFGTPLHVEAVRKLLAATGGSEEELDCGLQEGRPPDPIFDNCSGKHAGMLATCRAHGWPIEGYRRPEHPLQTLLLEEVAAAGDLEPNEVRIGIDGCGDRWDEEILTLGAAVRALGAIRDETAIPSLMKALRHTVTRAEAADALTRFGSAVIAPLLAVLARESDDNIRYHVKETLAKVGWRAGRI